MAAQVVSFFQRFQPSHDWTQRELAEFYRVESALIQAGLQLETDRGVTDEGDPWFVFCRADNGDVFIHFARIDGQYIAVGAALEQIVQGKDFPTLVQEMLATQAWAMAKARNHSNVFLHPAALLIALVGGAFFHSGEAKAAETVDHARADLRRHALPILLRDMGGRFAPALEATETTTILSSVLIGLNSLAPFTPSLADAPPGVQAMSASDLIVLPPPLSAPSAPISRTMSLITDPVVSPTPLAPLSQPHQLIAAASLEIAPPVANAIVVDQHIINPPPFSGVVADGVHLGVAAPIASIGAVLVQISATDAAEIIQSSNILSYFNAQSGLAPVTPPPALTDLITHGEHAAPAATSPLGSPDGNSSPTSPSPPASDPASPSPDLLAANSPMVTAAVAHFAAEVSVLDMAFSGHEVILYDGAIFKSLPSGTSLDSVTFNFADGSSISLVGTAAEMQHLHLS
jgi:hypothetical protein